MSGGCSSPTARLVINGWCVVEGVLQTVAEYIDNERPAGAATDRVLTEIRNRGTKDVCIVVCDGLTDLVDAVGAVWPQAIVQTCIVHLLRNSFRYASRRDWPAIARDLKPIYNAPTEAAAMDCLGEFAELWE